MRTFDFIDEMMNIIFLWKKKLKSFWKSVLLVNPYHTLVQVCIFRFFLFLPSLFTVTCFKKQSSGENLKNEYYWPLSNTWLNTKKAASHFSYYSVFSWSPFKCFLLKNCLKNNSPAKHKISSIFCSENKYSRKTGTSIWSNLI